MRRRRARAGLSTLEIQVALVVLGIALAGICPIVMMQLKLLRRIEDGAAANGAARMIRGQRIVDGVPEVPEGGDPAPPLAVLRPDPDAWVRRLGIAATIADRVVAPTPDTTPTEATVEDVEATLVGDWGEQASVEASSGSCRLLDAGTTEGSATWTFGAITPAYYRVLLSWPGSVPVPPDAAYTLAAEASGPVVGPVPQGHSAGGIQWLDLGNHRLRPGTTLRLGRSATGAVVADAVRIGKRNRVTLTGPPTADSGTTPGPSARVRMVTRP